MPDYTDWDYGQPNNFKENDMEEGQGCAMLFKGHWNDYQCSMKLPYVCQIVFFDI